MESAIVTGLLIVVPVLQMHADFNR